MPKKYLSFDDYIKENNSFVSEFNNIDQNVDFSEVAPQFFHNGFNLGSAWFEGWIDRNNLKTSTNEHDLNFLNVFDTQGKWIAAYHQHKGKIFTNKTLYGLHESFEFTEEDFKLNEEDALAAWQKAYKEAKTDKEKEVAKKWIEHLGGSVTEDLNEANLNKLYKDLAKVQMKMKELAKKYKGGDKSVVSELKKLTQQKKKLEAEIEEEVGMLDDQFDESIDEGKNLLKQDSLSSEEYQKAKKLKGFNSDDYTFDGDQMLYKKKNESVTEADSEFVVVGIKNDYATIMSKPFSSKSKAEDFAKITTPPRGETIKVIQVKDLKDYKVIESLGEKKDHVVVIKKDGESFKTTSMEKALADKLMKKLLKDSKGKFDGVEVLQESEAEEIEVMSESYLEQFESNSELLELFNETSNILNSVYESEESEDMDVKLDKVIENLDQLVERLKK